MQYILKEEFTNVKKRNHKQAVFAIDDITI